MRGATARRPERSPPLGWAISPLLPGGGGNLRTPPSPPRGVNLLLGGSDPPSPEG